MDGANEARRAADSFIINWAPTPAYCDGDCPEDCFGCRNPDCEKNELAALGLGDGFSIVTPEEMEVGGREESPEEVTGKELEWICQVAQAESVFSAIAGLNRERRSGGERQKPPAPASVPDFVFPPPDIVEPEVRMSRIDGRLCGLACSCRGRRERALTTGRWI